jgi:hypothetical protein
MEGKRGRSMILSLVLSRVKLWPYDLSWMTREGAHSTQAMLLEVAWTPPWVLRHRLCFLRFVT